MRLCGISATLLQQNRINKNIIKLTTPTPLGINKETFVLNKKGYVMRKLLVIGGAAAIIAVVRYCAQGAGGAMDARDPARYSTTGGR